IETKNYIARFITKPRQDSRGVIDEEGGVSSGLANHYLEKIILYSKKNLPDTTAPESEQLKKAIKVVYFEYDYSLCKGVPNTSYTGTINPIGEDGGKLTLKKIYFAYQGSQKGRFSPYVFNYDEKNP